MRKGFLLIILLLAVLGAVGYGAWLVYQFLAIPPDSEASERIVLIEPGTSLRRTAEILREESVIGDKNLFMILARFYRDGKSIKAGEYQFTTSMLPIEVLEKLQDGKVFFSHLYHSRRLHQLSNRRTPCRTRLRRQRNLSHARF